MRQEILFDTGWRFHRGDIETPQPAWKGPAYSQSKTERKQCGPAARNYPDQPDQFVSDIGLLCHERWQWVRVPHDYVVDQIPDEHENNSFGFLHHDNAWYRRHFTVPAEARGKRLLLQFGGVAGETTVYLNGCRMGHNYSAYNAFTIDISDYADFERENVLAVYVDRREFEGWWYQGGGIYRTVRLTVTDPVAIDEYGVYAPYTKLDEHRWCIDLQTTVVNDSYEDCNVTAKTELLDKNGVCVAYATGEGSVASREKGVLRYVAEVTDPLLWDCDAPNLYTVRTTLLRDGTPCDEDTTRIGFRTVEITPEHGLLLNGKRTQIKGLCGHQDYGLTGLAVPDNVARYKVKLMKEMGANGYRTSHYCYGSAYMDAFDEMGFLVLAESRWFETTDEAFKQLDALILRDRNRPSVIFWSTSNEEPLHITDVGRRIHRSIAAHIRKLDANRPIIAAQDKTPDKSTIYDDSDLVAVNYNLPLFDMLHEAYPDKAVLSSECAAMNSTRGWHYPPNTNERFRDNDTQINDWFWNRESTWKYLMERPYVIGGYFWVGIEYRGEADWPALCARSGAIDLYLQKKGCFWQNRAFWTDEPMAHIVPHWNFEGLEGHPILVTVFTNCDELELFLNGESVGRKPIERYCHGEWNVPYASGKLRVVGYRDGTPVCEDTVATTGKPVRLRLTLDNEFEPNGRDLALFTCECVDENGVAVPDAADFVRFTVNAPAEIVGTGSDHCDHTRVSLPDRKMYMGKISIAVRPAEGQKKLELYAHSDSLADCVWSREFTKGE